jgi:hypothetical protein
MRAICAAVVAAHGILPEVTDEAGRVMDACVSVLNTARIC